MRWIVLGLLAVGTVALPAAPAAAQQAPPNPCDTLTAPGADPCQPIPVTQPGLPGLLERFLAPDQCTDWAAQAALPSLQQAYAYQPGGYGPYGWGPLTQPFGAGAYGPATLYSPPGLVPVYGPLGPGQTAAVLAPQAFPNGLPGPAGMPAADARNALTALSLAGLQQAELGTLYGRQILGPLYQAAAGMYVSGYSTQASAVYTILRGLCHGMQAGAQPAGTGR
jgi:hypothetical protein